jgi:alcohol dehydrogenase (NADP+)
MEHAALRTGALLSRVGLGTWNLSKEHVGPAVHAALLAGYRHIDCASIYGNEAQVSTPG